MKNDWYLKTLLQHHNERYFVVSHQMTLYLSHPGNHHKATIMVTMKSRNNDNMRVTKLRQ